MKKMIVSVAAVATLLLTACGNSTNTANTTENTAAAVENTAAAVNVTSLAVVPAETTIHWTGSKPIGKHTGTLGVSAGQVDMAGDKLVGGIFTLDMNTINVTDLQGDDKAYLEGHLKGTAKPEDADHFFNVTKFPTATFALKSYDGLNAHGELTVKGITKAVSFPAKVSVSAEQVSIESEIFTINRVDFGVQYGSKSVFENLGDKFINDEIELQVKAVAKK